MNIVTLQNLNISLRSDIFKFLEDNKVIDSELANRLKKMVGFKKIPVYNYQEVSSDVIDKIINNLL